MKDALAAVAEARDGEIAPFTEKVTAIREKYYPLDGQTKKVTGSLVLMKTALLAVKSDWGRREDARIAREAAEARREAEERARIAAEAVRASAGDIDAAERAEDLVHDAREAQREVRQVESQTVRGMRDNWVIKGFVDTTDENHKWVDGPTALLRHYWTTNRDALTQAALELARADVRSGKRQIPGLLIENERRAI